MIAVETRAPRRAAARAHLPGLLDMLAEFDAVDVYSDELDHDTGNLIIEIRCALATWAGALRCGCDGDDTEVWESAACAYTLMQAVRWSIDDLADGGYEVRVPDFQCLELCVRHRPMVLELCPEYAEWKRRSA